MSTGWLNKSFHPYLYKQLDTEEDVQFDDDSSTAASTTIVMPNASSIYADSAAEHAPSGAPSAFASSASYTDLKNFSTLAGTLPTPGAVAASVSTSSGPSSQSSSSSTTSSSSSSLSSAVPTGSSFPSIRIAALPVSAKRQSYADLNVVRGAAADAPRSVTESIASSARFKIFPTVRVQAEAPSLLDAKQRHSSSFTAGWKHLQYLFLGCLVVIDLCLIPGSQVNLVFKVVGFTAYVGLCMYPSFSSLCLPLMPVVTWALTFYASRYLPLSVKPPIFTTLLPDVENAIFGGNINNFFSSFQSPFLDILAWIPYGILHFALPVVLSCLLFILGPPGTLPVWAHAFGYMNLFGVLTQIAFPNAPPWYAQVYGNVPADYSMLGSAGGLARIDKLFHNENYTFTFSTAPIVFGAFPSLHSGCACLEAFFMGHLIPKFGVIWGLYVMWIWWSTMYFTHHYILDLIGGLLYAAVAYRIFKSSLPSINAKCRYRWNYGTCGRSSREGLSNLDRQFSDVLQDVPGVGAWLSRRWDMLFRAKYSPAAQTIRRTSIEMASLEV